MTKESWERVLACGFICWVGACTIAAALGMVMLAGVIGVGWSIAIVSVVAVVATHFAFRSFEIQIFTALSIVLTLMIPSDSPWSVAILGAVAGLMAGVAIVGILARPNERAAAEEASRKQGDAG